MATRIELPTIPLRLPAEHTAGVSGRTATRPVVVIQASGWWPGLRLQELWEYRSLLRFLVWRDIKVKYAQTMLGAGWAMLQPVLTMLVFTVIFGIFAGMPSEGVPFSLFALSALVPWLYFSNAIAHASNSLIANTNLITKVYFPRLLVPFAPLLSGLVDFLFGFAFLLGLMLLKGYAVSPQTLLLLPVPLAILMLTAAGVGYWLAALNIQYRDVAYVVPFMLQVWMYCCPTFYPASMVPEAYRAVYALNPMVGVIAGFRAVLFGTSTFEWALTEVSVCVALGLFVSGVIYFRHTERVFADVI